MDDDPFKNVSLKTDAAAAVANARGFCTICLQERILSITEYTGAVGLACPVCGARKTYPIRLLRPTL
jgi:hypothetical protein